MNCNFFIGSALLLLLFGCGNSAPLPIAPEEAKSTIKIGGSSETYELLEQLVEAYQSESDDISFDFLPPSQTSGGIQGVKSTILDIGGVSSNPTAQDMDEQIHYVSLAQTPLVVVVHNSVTGISDISGEQIKGIYSGQISNWKMLGGPDENIIVFDFTEDENEKKVLREAYLGQELAITPRAIVFPEDDELLETAAITEFSIAAVPYENKLDDLPLIQLSIDGIAPSMETIQSGEYTMTLPLGIVVNKELSADDIEPFVSFATSSQGQQILTENNYIPSNAN